MIGLPEFSAQRWHISPFKPFNDTGIEVHSERFQCRESGGAERCFNKRRSTDQAKESYAHTRRRICTEIAEQVPEIVVRESIL
jgi:hypothetical protein